MTIGMWVIFALTILLPWEGGLALLWWFDPMPLALTALLASPPLFVAALFIWEDLSTMPAAKPFNHVTRQQAAAMVARMGAVKATSWPDISDSLLEFLELVFPPRCYRPEEESLENHLKYAGKVELVAAMRQVADERRKPAEGDDDGEDGDDDGWEDTL